MVWLFILLTIATYSFVMKHVLSNIQKPAKAVKALYGVKQLKTELHITRLLQPGNILVFFYALIYEKLIH